MKTVLELKEVLRKKGQELEANPDFLALQRFYEEMKSKGIARKQEYSLPPLDTAGQRIYQAQQECACHLKDGEL